MAFTITSGGSLTTALSLTLLAWGIRALRGAALRNILQDTSNRFNLAGLNYLLSRLLNKRRRGKFASVAISSAAFRYLVEERPVGFVVFRVYREEKEVARSSTTTTEDGSGGSSSGSSSGSSAEEEPLVAETQDGILAQARCLPERALKDLLLRSLAPRALNNTTTAAGSSTTRRPTIGSLERMAEDSHRSSSELGDEEKSQQQLRRTDLVVLVSDEGDERIEQFASYTCELGFRCVYVKGGAQSLGGGEKEGASSQAGVEGITRDGIFSLMYLSKTRQLSERKGGKQQASPAKGSPVVARTHVYDVRRHDELSLFGTFEGAKHLPSGHTPHGLHLSEEEWEKKFRHPKPASHDVIVLICNTGLRSKWVAHLFLDLGYAKVYYGKDGTNSWHLDPTLCDYNSYEFGSDEIPAPELFALEQVNFDAGQRELAKLGLLDVVSN
ncbi:hypothetical protein HOP50_16g78560 [Chloropicon primus]|uniref:Rhodanese domain-containing protein n=1 Tax=Chloropicon primus TaxID=1764295 RepID=A0A5B8MWV5_9CHLO|nr:hypothetical protein A3770_16p78260 [Chloropicon primus]UPR04514.1 hypothetical protein HOP50_16g78560 [Chloropicon primus]|eukprot:QDZ25308.1 hypothetical protein A3770_16p78260 [Chloropicon primus]